VTVTPDTTGRIAHDSQRVLPPDVAERLYGRLRAELGAVVLDVGAGSGVVGARLGDRVVLTDLVDWRSVSLPFVLADAAALPFASGSFTGVHLARVLHHVPDWRAVLRESVRVLAAGGALCLSLGDRPVVDPLRELVDRAVALAGRRGLREAPVAGPDPVSADSYLAGSGLADVTAFECGGDVVVTAREMLTGVLGNPFRWVADADLGVVPGIVADVLAAAGVDPDAPVTRDRTVRYRVYRSAGR
jgi:SAM-dependent methyltransferase